jgi:hypothetical protein
MTGLEGAYRVKLEWAAENHVTQAAGKTDKVKPDADTDPFRSSPLFTIKWACVSKPEELRSRRW